MGHFGPKPSHAKVGEHSEALIAARLLEAGYIVLKPMGNSDRYDLVIESGDGQFYRIQCKTAFIHNSNGETIVFATSSSYYHTRYNGRKDYAGQVDYFAVYYPENKQTYLVPAEGLPKTEAHLRLDATKNGQGKKIRWAVDYLL